STVTGGGGTGTFTSDAVGAGGNPPSGNTCEVPAACGALAFGPSGGSPPSGNTCDVPAVCDPPAFAPSGGNPPSGESFDGVGLNAGIKCFVGCAAGVDCGGAGDCAKDRFAATNTARVIPRNRQDARLQQIHDFVRMAPPSENRASVPRRARWRESARTSYHG